jgi:hypothetical protein
MAVRVSKSWRIVFWVTGSAALVVGSLIVTDPFIPSDVAFGTEDLAARRQYEQIVASHGFSYRYDKNVHGETLVVIDGITPREYHPIDCEFYTWSSNRDRARGIIVLGREDCAL